MKNTTKKYGKLTIKKGQTSVMFEGQSCFISFLHDEYVDIDVPTGKVEGRFVHYQHVCVCLDGKVYREGFGKKAVAPVQ